MKWRMEPVSKSLFEEMKEHKHPSLKIGKKPNLVPDSSLLRDVKEGKEPEKNHVTLDKFFNPNSMQNVTVN